MMAVKSSCLLPVTSHVLLEYPTLRMLYKGVRYTASNTCQGGEARGDDLLPSVGTGIGPDNLPTSGCVALGVGSGGFDGSIVSTCSWMS